MRAPHEVEHLIVRILSGREGKPSPPESAARFLELCQSHGVSAIILAKLKKEGISGSGWEGILQQLEKIRRQYMVRNIYLLDRLRAFHSTLRKAGIPSIVLKGASLLYLLYTDIGLRPMTDVDVLIRKQDLRETLDLLANDGWQVPHEEEIKYFHEHFYHLDIRTNDDFATLFEIHWNLEKELCHSIEIAGLWERAIDADHDGDSIRRLSNEDLILHLLIHLAYHHYFSPRLIWVHDIKEMIGRCSLDWDLLLTLAERWRIRTPVYYSLQYLEKIFPGAVPAEIFRRTAIGWMRKRLLRLGSAPDPLFLTRPFDNRFLRWTTSLYFIDKPIDIIRMVWKHSGPKLQWLSRQRKLRAG